MEKSITLSIYFHAILHFKIFTEAFLKEIYIKIVPLFHGETKFERKMYTFHSWSKIEVSNVTASLKTTSGRSEAP